MAPMARTGAVCVVLLSVLSTITCGQDHWAYDIVDQNASDVVQVDLPSTAPISSSEQLSPSDQDGITVVDTVMPDVKSSELKEDMIGAKLANDGEKVEEDILFPEEANEPIATKKKVSCLGCATQVDIDISPENREAVEKLGEEIVKVMDSMYVGPFIHARPNILSVQKQVELGTKYIITFESRLSSCLKEDTRKRSECPPQEESRICVAELLRKHSQPDIILSNNCTDTIFPMNSVPNNIPVLKINNDVFSVYEPLKHDNIDVEEYSQQPYSEERQGGPPSRDFSISNSDEALQERSESVEFESIRPRRWTNVGALKDVTSDEKDLVSQFAQLAVKTLDEVDPDDSRRIVLRVVEAKKQIVNGIMYHLVLHVATSDCPEDYASFEDSTMNCVEDKQHPEKICRVQIHRSWSGESPHNAKVVKSECADLWLDGVPPEAPVSGRSGRSRQGEDSWATADDWEKYDMQDQALQGCLHEAIDSLHDILLLDDVTKAASMMDAHARVNQKTEEQELAVTVFLANPKKLKSTEDIEKPVVIAYHTICNRRHRRAAQGRPGGIHEADENDSYVKELINFGLGEVEKSSNGPYRLAITRVIQVQKQVVSGTLLHVKIEISPTNCLKSDGSQAENCSPSNTNEGLQICSLKIWDQPWLKHREVTEMKCEPSSSVSRSRRETLLGAPTELDVSHPYVKELADFALTSIHKDLNSLQSLKIVRILEAKRQLVSGTLMHLKVEVSPSDCQIVDKVKSEQCSNGGNQESVTCSFKVWDQPWTSTRQVQDLQCGQSRHKRDVLVGAPETVDTDDAYVKELAGFAVLELDKLTNTPYQQKVIRITEAKKQVVAGILMHLKMELGTTSCRKGESSVENCAVNSEEKQVCSLKVFDQSWTKKREVQDVQCGTVRARRSLQSKREVSRESSPTKVNIEDPYILESAWYAVAEMDKGINSPFYRRPEKIVQASIEHSKYTTVKLHLKVATSSCRKNPSCTDFASTLCRKPAQGSPDCPSRDDTSSYMCYVEIIHRPWTKERFLSKSKCTSLSDQPVVENSHLIGSDDHDLHAGLFREFMHRFNKTYPSDTELKARFRIFRENLKLIKELQAGEQGTAVYGPTLFADLTPHEFKQKYLGLRPDLHQENAIPMRHAEIPNIDIPEAFDWRDHNVVTPVKNQGACGSCWAFAVTGNLEGQYALKHGKLLSLSEQELVDCDKLDSGCNGGLFETAYQSIEQLGGLETESDYPYEGINDQCQFNRSEVQVRLASSVNITSNETAMAQWLVKNGPIAIAINANAMQFYVGGVSHPFKFLCSPNNLDHGVLIVGYGVHTTSIRHKVLPYWIIKNSWSTWWGEKGYYRVYRGDGTCGVNKMASSGIVA